MGFNEQVYFLVFPLRQFHQLSCDQSELMRVKFICDKIRLILDITNYAKIMGGGGGGGGVRIILIDNFRVYL